MTPNSVREIDRASSRRKAPSIVRQFLSVPNQLTLVRMVVLPFILIAMIYRQHDMALGLFLVAALTDGIDGIIARRFNQKTSLGAYLDPLADKLLLSSAFVVQALIGSLPWWLAILVLSRDVLILSTVVVVMLATPVRDFPPSVFGKVNTGVQVATIAMVVLHNYSPSGWTADSVGVLIWAAAGTTLVSSVHYTVETMQRLHGHLTGASDSET